MDNSESIVDRLTDVRFVCLSICYKEHVRDDIKKKYLENEIENFECFKRTGIYKSDDETIFSKQDVHLHESCNFLYSIYARMFFLARENPTDENKKEVEDISKFVFNICKKAYRNVFNYIINNSSINLDDFYYDYLPRKNKKISDNDRMFSTIALLHLISYCREHDNRLDKEVFDGNVLKVMASNIDSIEVSGYIFEKVNPEDYCQGLNEWNNLYKKALSEKNYYDLLLSIQKVEYNSDILDIDKLVAERRRCAMNGNVSKHLSSLAGWLRAHGIELNTLSETMLFTKEHIEKIFSYINYKNRSYEDVCAMVPTLLVTDLLINEIKSLQKLYFKDQKNEEILRYKKFKQEIDIQKQEILRESENFRMEKLKLQEKNKSLSDENEVLQKEIKKLKLELEKKNSEKAELLGLREYMFNSQKNIENEEIQEEKIFNPEKIKNEKILIIGGQVAWQNKIKEVLPNVTFLGENQLNFDTKMLKKYPYIGFKIDFLSHAMYYKVMENKSATTRIGYFTGHNNINITLNEIEKLCTEII